MSIKRGCQASFTFKKLYHIPDILEICILHRQHLNQWGLIIHRDLKVGNQIAMEDNLLDAMKRKAAMLLHFKLSVPQIIFHHMNDLKDHVSANMQII